MVGQAPSDDGPAQPKDRRADPGRDHRCSTAGRGEIAIDIDERPRLPDHRDRAELRPAAKTGARHDPAWIGQPLHHAGLVGEAP